MVATIHFDTENYDYWIERDEDNEIRIGRLPKNAEVIMDTKGEAMTVEGVLYARLRLEEEISELLYKFTQKTGLVIDCVGIERRDFTKLRSGASHSYSVTLEVKL